jgi:deoxyribose-phosphate aldolase
MTADSTVDLARLVAMIADEVAAETGSAERCRCHAVRADRCPDLLARVVGAGATRLGFEAPTGVPPTIASLIDHTLLRPEATRDEIGRLCAEAAQYGFATVCVNPVWVPTAVALLRGSRVGVCAVVGFPLGASMTSVKAFEARQAIDAGATEIDMVMQIGALKSGDPLMAARDVQAVADPCGARGVGCKVIIEAALLTDAEKVAACVIAKAAGATYVKTSTGFGPGGATEADVALMRRVVGPDLGVKAAGGVRDFQKLRAMVAAGATRIGASAGVRIATEAAAAAQEQS